MAAGVKPCPLYLLFLYLMLLVIKVDIDDVIKVNLDPDELLSLSPVWRLFAQQSQLPVSHVW